MGPFGSRIKADNFRSVGVPIIKGGNLNGEFLREQAFDYLRPEKADELMTANAKRLDIVITHRGTLGQVGIIPERSKFDRYVVSQSQLKLTFNRDIVNPYFIYYFLKSSEGQSKLLQNTSQVGVPAIAKALTSIRQINLRLPEREEQDAIVNILLSLDQRIVAIDNINATFEGISQTIFKSWFVDFDPVRAKAAGREPEGMDATTAALFPDAFQNSEIGPIPYGWSVSAIKELTSNIQYGLTTSAQSEALGPKFLRITDIQGGLLDWNTVPYCKASETERQRYKLKPHDIVVARTGASTGENIYLPVIGLDAVFASYLVRFQFENPDLARFVGSYMRTANYFDFVRNSIGGSAQPNASAQVLAGAKLAVAKSLLQAKYAECVAPVNQKIWHNVIQASTLRTLRDTLLPRLIFGRLRAPEAEKMVEAVL